MFELLLHLDTIRGHHSTGVASVKGEGDWDLVKKKGVPWDLFDSKQYSTMMAGFSYALIGHNRAATKGKVNAINAHPFEFQDVVGAHNGTLRGQHRLPDHTQFEVDSENIFHAIQRDGLNDTLAVLDGAFALTYWDKRTEDLVLLRNNERTLYFCYSQDRKTVFWASEAWMLSVALSRNNIKYTEITDVTECVIHRFKFDRTAKGSTVEVELERFEEFRAPLPAASPFQGNAKAKPTVPVQDRKIKQPRELLKKNVEFTIDCAQYTTGGVRYLSGRLLADDSYEVRLFIPPDGTLWKELLANYDTIWIGHVQAYADYSGALFLNIQPGSIQEAVDEGDEGDDGELIYEGFDKRMLTEDQFLDKTQKGCCWCAGPATILDAPFIMWLSDTEHLCADCQQEQGVKEYLKGAV